MPRTQRSPPNKAGANSYLLQVSSDSDIPHSITSGLSTFEKVNMSTRSKRPRAESPPAIEVASLRKEILDILTTWKNEQEASQTTFMKEQSSSISKLLTEIADLKLHYHAIQKSNEEIEKNITFISRQYDDLIKQFEVLQKEKQTYRECINQLELKVQDLQQGTRPSSIEIRNVPRKENETTSDLSKIISNLGTAIGMQLMDSDIRDLYRLPGKPGTTRPIVTEFSSVQKKNKVLSSVRNFNKKQPKEDRLNSHTIGVPGDRQPVYIAEYLPASSRKLLHATREFAKAKDYKFCWTANGNIFLRKIEGAKSVIIRSEKSLMELINQ